MPYTLRTMPAVSVSTKSSRTSVAGCHGSEVSREKLGARWDALGRLTQGLLIRFRSTGT